jgi:hypothetical protein
MDQNLRHSGVEFGYVETLSMTAILVGMKTYSSCELATEIEVQRTKMVPSGMRLEFGVARSPVT